jgi:ATP-dependent Clp protease adaptor protein ClpS
MMGKKDYQDNRPKLKEYIEKDLSKSKFLVLHNDDIHTFDYVIESLIRICKMDTVQAEQCTFLVHYKGKCDVKKGTAGILKPLKDGLIERGLNATIE